MSDKGKNVLYECHARKNVAKSYLKGKCNSTYLVPDSKSKVNSYTNSDSSDISYSSGIRVKSPTKSKKIDLGFSYDSVNSGIQDISNINICTDTSHHRCDESIITTERYTPPPPPIGVMNP